MYITHTYYICTICSFSSRSRIWYQILIIVIRSQDTIGTYIHTHTHTHIHTYTRLSLIVHEDESSFWRTPSIRGVSTCGSSIWIRFRHWSSSVHHSWSSLPQGLTWLIHSDIVTVHTVWSSNQSSSQLVRWYVISPTSSWITTVVVVSLSSLIHREKKIFSRVFLHFSHFIEKNSMSKKNSMQCWVKNLKKCFIWSTICVVSYQTSSISHKKSCLKKFLKIYVSHFSLTISSINTKGRKRKWKRERKEKITHANRERKEKNKHTLCLLY